MSPAEKLLNRAYSAANNPQTFTQKEAGPRLDKLKMFFKSKENRKDDFFDNLDMRRVGILSGGVGTTGILGTAGVLNYADKLDRPEEEPVDFSKADKSREESLGTASLAALGGAGGGLASVVYGKLADKPNLQRDLIATLTGTAIGAAVGSIK